MIPKVNGWEYHQYSSLKSHLLIYYSKLPRIQVLVLKVSTESFIFYDCKLFDNDLMIIKTFQ